MSPLTDSDRQECLPHLKKRVATNKSYIRQRIVSGRSSHHPLTPKPAMSSGSGITIRKNIASSAQASLTRYVQSCDDNSRE